MRCDDCRGRRSPRILVDDGFKELQTSQALQSFHIDVPSCRPDLQRVSRAEFAEQTRRLPSGKLTA